MKHAVLCLFSMLVGIAVGIAAYGSYQAHNFHYETAEPEIQYVYIEKEPEIITETIYIEVEPEFYRTISDEDSWYYLDICMREAEGEDVIGMLWVMYTFECRCEAFGHTPAEEWASSAFQTSMFRTGLEPNEKCLKAYELFCEGWQPKPLYFAKGYYHSFANDLCTIGNHCFSY